MEDLLASDSMGEEIFQYRNGVLHCEDCSLEEVAAAVRPPFYVYGGSGLLARYRAFEAAFASVPHLTCYALKANAQPALLRLLAGEGAGAEVVSEAELALALRVGFPAQKIVLSGVGKTEAELAAGLRAGILLFTIESEGELHLLERLAAKAGTMARVGLRINPDVDARTHRRITTGVKNAKFGVDAETARELYARRAAFPHLDFSAIHAHIGSQVTEMAPLAEAARLLAALAAELRQEGVPIRMVNVGGGLGIAYDGGEDVPGFADYARAIAPLFAEGDLRLLLEPGRSLAAPVGALALEILYKKKVHGRGFLVVNGGMNDLLRPALYDAFHRIVPVRKKGAALERVDVVGAVCESSDVFGRDRELPGPEPGDLLAVLDAGAYGFAMSSHYNLRPRPAEVLVEGKSFRVVRPAETVEELVARELGAAR